LGSNVIVVGGGNTAIDAARTALRLSAREVTIIYRRSRQEMPASREEVEEAEKEGVRFLFLANPLKIGSFNGRVRSVECCRMTLGAPDLSGRRRPETVKDSEFTLDVSTVIIAAGQAVDTSCLDAEFRNLHTRNSRISASESTQETGIKGVFAGGDCTSGPATAVEAIASGRRAAVAINLFLRNQKVVAPVLPYNCSTGELSELNPEMFAGILPIPRSIMPVLKIDERKNNFAEIALGLSIHTAQKEASRCLSCGCQDVFECQLRKLATEHAVNDKTFAGEKQNLPVSIDEHPYILRDRNKCILCGRCIRICSEVAGITALGYVYRGVQTCVEPTMGLPLRETACNSCGLCISTCPTGAMILKVPLPKPGPFKPFPIPIICPQCNTPQNTQFHLCEKQLKHC
jgi:formate dehydrogenase major subunit